MFVFKPQVDNVVNDMIFNHNIITLSKKKILLLSPKRSLISTLLTFTLYKNIQLSIYSYFL